MDRLTYKHDDKWCISGINGKLISDKHANYWGESIDRLAYYENLEEQRKLLILPCKIGDTLYDIFEALNNGNDEIKEFKVSKIQIDIMKNGRAFLVVENTMFPFDDFGKTTFLNREEAEVALKRIKW